MSSGNDQAPSHGLIMVQNRPFRREQLRGNPRALFVWEDTLEHRQATLAGTRYARECHGEFNAVAIVTKKLAGNAPYCSFTDDDARPGNEAIETIRHAFERIQRHLENGGHAYFPGNPIGSEAELIKSAPAMWGRIERMRLDLFRKFPVRSVIESKVA